MRWSLLGAAAAALGLAGCVPPPPPPVYAVPAPAAVPGQEAPLVAVPGPGKSEAAFQADDQACRADVARLPARSGARPTPAQLRAAQAAAADPSVPPPPPEALPPGPAFLRCMTARGNQVSPLQAQQAFPAYAYLPAYPVYAGVGFGYPFFYDDPFLVRFYGGYGYRGYGFGRYGFGGYRGYGPRYYGAGYYGRRYGGYGGRGYYGGYRGGYGRR